MNDYFTNTTAEQRLTIAQYNQYMIGEKVLPIGITDEKVKEAIQSTCGDSYVTVIKEDDHNLVYLSVDTHIKVINVINKTYFDHSIAFEVDEVLSATKL